MKNEESCIHLHYIQNLLLDLLQLVFHLHHNLLHLGMIGLAAQGIDFAAHLLSNEAQLLSLSATVLQRRDKIFQVIAQALLLFVDVQLLDVIDEFPAPGGSCHNPR